MGPPFGRFVSKLPRNGESFFVILDGLSEITQQVMGVAQIAAGPALGRYVAQFAHQSQVFPVGSAIRCNTNYVCVWGFMEIREINICNILLAGLANRILIFTEASGR